MVGEHRGWGGALNASQAPCDFYEGTEKITALLQQQQQPGKLLGLRAPSKLSAEKLAKVQTLAPKRGWNEVNSWSRTFKDSLGLSKILDINSLIIDTNEL